MKNNGDWLAIFCRLGVTECLPFAIKAEADRFLRFEEDAGEIYPIAIYRRSNGKLYMRDRLEASSKKAVRKKIKELSTLITHGQAAR